MKVHDGKLWVVVVVVVVCACVCESCSSVDLCFPCCFVYDDRLYGTVLISFIFFDVCVVFLFFIIADRYA